MKEDGGETGRYSIRVLSGKDKVQGLGFDDPGGEMGLCYRLAHDCG